jgi:hypothetical protein
MKNNYLLLFVFVSAAIGFTLAADVDPALDARLEKRQHTLKQTTLPYRLYVPENDTVENCPLLLFLHGARWCGSDNITQLDNELAVYWVQDSIQNRFPSFVLIPQCPSGQSWETVSGEGISFPPNPVLETIKDLLDSLAREFSIDENRIYIAGKSMGGQGVYGMLSRYPETFSAAVIVAGPHAYNALQDISDIPMWLFHAKYDETVSVDESREVVSGLESLGSQFIYIHCNFHEDWCGQMADTDISQAILNGSRYFFSEFDTSGHQIEPLVVRTYGLCPWIFAQNRQRTGCMTNHPMQIQLFLNYPNPFNHSSQIAYTLSETCRVRICVFDILGNEIAVLADEKQEAGEHAIRFDAGNLASGIYLAELNTGNAIRQIKMILAK